MCPILSPPCIRFLACICRTVSIPTHRRDTEFYRLSVLFTTRSGAWLFESCKISFFFHLLYSSERNRRFNTDWQHSLALHCTCMISVPRIISLYNPRGFIFSWLNVKYFSFSMKKFSKRKFYGWINSRVNSTSCRLSRNICDRCRDFEI